MTQRTLEKTEMIEISQLDLRYESYRIKNPAAEAKLLSMIAEKGIEEALEGVELSEGSLLLNGFKRYRCARKLQIHTVPFRSLGPDAVCGIIQLLRQASSRSAKSLNLLEEAAFVEQLHRESQMSVAEIAGELSRSKAWVCMRLKLFEEMPAAVAKELFAGRFPVYAYMYTIRQFMRMNGVGSVQIEEFVRALAGKQLSLREIEQLAHGFFRGASESFRRQVLSGNLALPLREIGQALAEPESSEFERVLLGDLERITQLMDRVMGKSEQRTRLKSGPFHAQAHLLTATILSRTEAFTQSMQQLHDRCR